MGFLMETKRYYSYNRVENKVFVARDNVFIERNLFLQSQVGVKLDLDEIRDEQQMDVDNTTSETKAYEIS